MNLFAKHFVFSVIGARRLFTQNAIQFRSASNNIFPQNQVDNLQKIYKRLLDSKSAVKQEYSSFQAEIPEAPCQLKKYFSLDVGELVVKYVGLLEDIVIMKNLWEESRTADASTNIENASEIQSLQNDAKKAGHELVEALLEKHHELMRNSSDYISDDAEVFLEVRPGVGGDEAGVFANDLFQMYEALASTKGWKFHEMHKVASVHNGCKVAIANISGPRAYGLLKNEVGVHRVQRVPCTERNGRIHTSTATVEVVPECSKVEVRIDKKDLKIEAMRASGPGGQSVNMSDTAVRITHIPTGISVRVEDNPSQSSNRDAALAAIKKRLAHDEIKKLHDKISTLRQQQVVIRDRSVKRRSYNYGRDSVTDHYCSIEVSGVQEFLKSASGLDDIFECINFQEATELVNKIIEDTANEVTHNEGRTKCH